MECADHHTGSEIIILVRSPTSIFDEIDAKIIGIFIGELLDK